MFRLCKLSLTLSRIRTFSSNAGSIQLVVDEKTNIAKVSLQRRPVNSLNTELLAEMNNVIENLEARNCKGLILTSNIPGIFTAGLDMMEFYKTNEERLTKFWTTLQDTWLKLYTSSFPTVALINGGSPAGGCLIAMSCDYRIMLGPHFVIGLNEAKIGIPAPFWFMDVMSTIIGHRKTEHSVLLGKMYKTEEALAIGLIDEAAKDQTEAEAKVDAYLSKMTAISPDCRTLMKREFRKDNVDKFLKRREEELRFIIDTMMLPQTQKKFESYFESLKKKTN